MPHQPLNQTHPLIALRIPTSLVPRLITHHRRADPSPLTFNHKPEFELLYHNSFLFQYFARLNYLAPMQNGDAYSATALHESPANQITTSYQRPKPPSRKGSKPKYSTDLTQARALQQLCYEVAASLREDLVSARSAKSRRDVSVAVRSAVQAWEICADRARIARNRPLPGSLRPEPIAKRKPAKQPATTFSETASEPIELDKRSQKPPDNPQGL